MGRSTGGAWKRVREGLANHLGDAQHRNAYYLMLNTLVGAATGLLFWFLMARVAGLPPSEVGVGYAIVALGTTVGVLAKGGLDTALLRTVPGASRPSALRLLGLGVLLGGGAAVALTVALAGLSLVTDLVENVATAGWALVGLIGLMLVATWLQDAYFLAEGDARLSFHRNLVFSAARLLLPIPILLLSLPRPVALTWGLALAVSMVAATAFARRLPPRDGREVPRREFLTSTGRNLSGSAAEFLPGLLLAPLVLALEGEAAAAYFGIAWTAASLLFLVSAAISRSALAEMVRHGEAREADAVRRAARQHLWTVVPAAALGMALAPLALRIFGADYAREGSVVLVLLCASTVAVAPAYLYLGVLRARERGAALLAFPAAMILALAGLAPWFADRWGLEGVAVAWFVANAPFGAYAAWQLRLLSREVTPAAAPTVGRAPHVE